jgi:hypothetical protein
MKRFESELVEERTPFAGAGGQQLRVAVGTKEYTKLPFWYVNQF